MTPTDTRAQDLDAISRISSIPTILRLVLRISGMRFAAVARVTEHDWMACEVLDMADLGVAKGDHLPVGTMPCHEVRSDRCPAVFGAASTDPRFARHATPARYGFESYVSVPILRDDGRFFGTLCAFDLRPAAIDDALVRTMEGLAQLIGAQLDDVEGREAAGDAEAVSRVRDELIGILAHDLRNPLQSVITAAELLCEVPLDERPARLVSHMLRNARRMADLLKLAEEFTRGRAGSGIALDRSLAGDLPAFLEQAVSDLRLANPDRAIESTVTLAEPVSCDPNRIAQLVNSLAATVLVHGTPESPIDIVAASAQGRFEVSVCSRTGLSDETIERLCLAAGEPSDVLEHGRGLGLYIAAQIARAHDGALGWASDPERGTRFTFRMPTGAE